MVTTRSRSACYRAPSTPDLPHPDDTLLVFTERRNSLIFGELPRYFAKMRTAGDNQCAFQHLSFHYRRRCCWQPVPSRRLALPAKQDLPVRKALPAHRVRLVRKVQRVLKDQWGKRAKPAPLVPPVQWDHKALPVRKVLLVLRVRLARRGLRDHQGPKARQAFKVLPDHPARRGRQVFKVPLDPKE
jgi:hypothetical protein